MSAFSSSKASIHVLGTAHFIPAANKELRNAVSC